MKKNVYTYVSTGQQKLTQRCKPTPRFYNFLNFKIIFFLKLKQNTARRAQDLRTRAHRAV